MDEAIRGAVLGGVIGAALVALEYMMLNKQAKERAIREHKKKPELDETARLRIKTLTRFAFVLPILFGAGFWLVWG